MQDLKPRFRQPDQSVYGSVQSCLRTNDLELVGDGTHLTHFEMVGNFSFGRSDYPKSVELWHQIVGRLGIKVTHVNIHPSRIDHQKLWKKLGYEVRPDPECVWSDGDIGGYCSEMFVGELEIGNLVNTQDISTDVGFGLERMVQVIEQMSRVDESSLFDQKLHPIVRDHSRTIKLLWEQGILPGNKGRGYVCRRLIRRILPLIDQSDQFEFQEWLEVEREGREKCLRQGKRLWRKHSGKHKEWWWETVGLLPEEVDSLK